MPVVMAEFGWSPSKIEAMHEDKKERQSLFFLCSRSTVANRTNVAGCIDSAGRESDPINKDRSEPDLAQLPRHTFFDRRLSITEILEISVPVKRKTQDSI